MHKNSLVLISPFIVNLANSTLFCIRYDRRKTEVRVVRKRIKNSFKNSKNVKFSTSEISASKVDKLSSDINGGNRTKLLVCALLTTSLWDSL